MTASTFNISDEDQRIARLAALAIVIHVAESALPSPLPGIKPGFANI
ncbi:MAG: Gx transporter family protein, partial [Granulosicoccaceae bacterium]